jgi:hypothetical protein
LVSFRISKFLHAVWLALGLQEKYCCHLWEKWNLRRQWQALKICNQCIIQVRSE